MNLSFIPTSYDLNNRTEKVSVACGVNQSSEGNSIKAPISQQAWAKDGYACALKN